MNLSQIHISADDLYRFINEQVDRHMATEQNGVAESPAPAPTPLHIQFSDGQQIQVLIGPAALRQLMDDWMGEASRGIYDIQDFNGQARKLFLDFETVLFIS
jgi:hypothetical protein